MERSGFPPGPVPTAGPRNLGLLIVSGILVSLGGGLVAPALPLLLQNTGLDLAHIGVVFSLGALGAIFLQPVLGGLSDRQGRRPVLGPIRLLCTLLLLLVAFGPSPQLVALALAARLALDQSTAPLLWAAVGDVTTAQNRASGIAWLTSATSAGYVVALFASHLVLQHLTLRQALGVSALLLLASGLALLALVEPRRVCRAGMTPATWKIVCEGLLSPIHYLRIDRSIFPLFLFVFLRSVAIAVFPVYFPLLLAQLGAEPAAIGPTIAASWLTYALVQPVGGRFAVARHKRIIGAGTFGMVVALFALALFAWHPSRLGLALVSIAWIVLAVPDGLSQPALSALQLELAPPAERGRFVGTLATVSTLGGVVAPLLYGMLAEHLSLPSAFVASALALSMSLVALLYVRGETR